jgi:hypothetical protein
MRNLAFLPVRVLQSELAGWEARNDSAWRITSSQQPATLSCFRVFRAFVIPRSGCKVASRARGALAMTAHGEALDPRPFRALVPFVLS